MKKTYLTPSMTVVRLQHHSIICQSSFVKGFSSTDDIDYGGGGSGDSYTRESISIWEDEW